MKDTGQKVRIWIKTILNENNIFIVWRTQNIFKSCNRVN